MNIHMRWPGGKVRALTLSYDDGMRQDKRFVEILNKNGLKCTFNINSGIYGKPEEADSGKGRMSLEELDGLYDGHEVAVHGETHPYLEQLPISAATREIVNDRINLERDFGGIIRGMAYPYGTFNDEVVEALESCGIAYSRTTRPTCSFAVPRDWLRLDPTCHHAHPDVYKLIDSFLGEHNGRAPRLFYLWGHTFEFDYNKVNNSWEHAEKFCEMLGGNDSVWYATNIEVYDYVKAYEKLIWSADAKRVYNPTVKELFFSVGTDRPVSVKPGETVEL